MRTTSLATALLGGFGFGFGALHVGNGWTRQRGIERCTYAFGNLELPLLDEDEGSVDKLVALLFESTLHGKAERLATVRI